MLIKDGRLAAGCSKLLHTRFGLVCDYFRLYIANYKTNFWQVYLYKSCQFIKWERNRFYTPELGRYTTGLQQPHLNYLLVVLIGFELKN